MQKKGWLDREVSEEKSNRECDASESGPSLVWMNKKRTNGRLKSGMIQTYASV